MPNGSENRAGKGRFPKNSHNATGSKSTGNPVHYRVKTENQQLPVRPEGRKL